MIQQPSWAKILQGQMAEKQQYDNQQREDQQQRKLRYKQELETDMMLHQQRKLIQHNQNDKLDSQMLETLRQRESKKLKEMEERKIKQIETSLENLNNQMISKKMSKERSYQSQLLDKEFTKQQYLREIKDIEFKKMRKDEDSKQLRQHYDQMIEEKRGLRQQLKQPHSLQSLDLPSQQIKQDTLQYQQDLNQQLQDKRKQLIDIQMRKQEERNKVEQKIAFEKQKLMEHKLKDFQIYKQYETDNYALLKERKKNDEMSYMDVQQMQRNNEQHLPRIYSDNYQPFERKKQLELLDQDLYKYHKMQQQQSLNNLNSASNIKPQIIQKAQTPLKTPLSESSKQSKKSRQIRNVTNQDQVGYSQIHQSKTQTPKSQSKNSAKTPVEINEKMLNQRYVPKKRSFNILTGIMQQQ